MRKTLLFFILAGMTIGAFAQQPRHGALLVGGSLGFNVGKTTFKSASTGNTTETNQAGFSLYPKVGFALADGLIVGGILNFGASSNKSGGPSGTKTTSTRIGAGPFARYYLPMGIFGEASFTAGAQSSKTKSGGVSSPKSVDGLQSFFIGAGYAYFLNSNVSLEPLVGFGLDRTKLDNNDVIKNGGLRVMASLTVYLRNE